MSRISITAGFILALSCGQAFAQTTGCFNDKISNTNEMAIRMISGQIYQAYPGSTARLSTWMPLDKVTICHISGTGVQITNLSKKNQMIKALQKTI